MEETLKRYNIAARLKLKAHINFLTAAKAVSINDNENTRAALDVARVELEACNRRSLELHREASIAMYGRALASYPE